MVTLLFFATELTVKFHSHIQLVSAIHSFIANESNMGLFHIYQTDTSFFFPAIGDTGCVFSGLSNSCTSGATESKEIQHDKASPRRGWCSVC